MRVAFAYLNPLVALWQSGGLRYVLAPDVIRQKNPAPPKTSEPRKSAPITRREPPTPPRERPRQKEQKWSPEPPENWPAVWRARLEQTQKGKIAWAYWRLGDDLCGATDDPEKAARRQLLAKLIKELGFPKGSHAFWPPTLPGDPNVDPRLFWSALHALGCRGTILLGSEIARAVMPDSDPKPLTRSRLNGQFVWILRDINYLAANPQHYEPTLLFLRQSLGRFVGL